MKVYVTFGQRYRDEEHPADSRAHPDGWFEFTGGSEDDVYRAISDYLTPNGQRVPLYSFTYEAGDFHPAYYPEGCLARFGVTDEGRVHDLEEARTWQ